MNFVINIKIISLFQTRHIIHHLTKICPSLFPVPIYLKKKIERKLEIAEEKRLKKLQEEEELRQALLQPPPPPEEEPLQDGEEEGDKKIKEPTVEFSITGEPTTGVSLAAADDPPTGVGQEEAASVSPTEEGWFMINISILYIIIQGKGV